MAANDEGESNVAIARSGFTRACRAFVAGFIALAVPALAVPFEPAAVAPAAFSAGAAAGVAAQPGRARSIKLAPLVTLTGISPASVTTTVNDFTLTVYGTGFTAPVFGPTPQPGTMVRLATPAGAPVLPTTFVSPTQLSVLVPGFGTALTRGSLARLALLSQMTEQAITAYLNSTGGMFCSFADVACPGSSGGTVTDSTGLSGDWRYIEWVDGGFIPSLGLDDQHVTPQLIPGPPEAASSAASAPVQVEENDGVPR